MSIAKIVVDVAQAHRKGEITTEFALKTLVGLYNEEHCTEWHDGVIGRAITLITGIPVIQVTIKED